MDGDQEWAAKDRLAADPLPADALYFRDGRGVRRRFALDGNSDRVLLGRSSRCDLVLEWDPEVSRAHAVLERVGEDWLVADDGISRNGTFINGIRLTGGRRLHHEDCLRVGGTVLTYRRANPDQLQSTVPGGKQPMITAAQRRVLRTLCRPMVSGDSVVPATNREIAEELHLAEDTVKDHLKELFSKFGLDRARPNEKRQQLARLARDRGLT